MERQAYTLIRSRRRTISLIVSPDATLTVRAPLRVPLSLVEKFVSEKNRWIHKTLTRLAARPKAELKRYVTGETFLYLGREYALTRTSGKKHLAFSEVGGFLLGEDRKHPHEDFVRWYREAARAVLSERVALYARTFELKVTGITITSAQTRWGSCSARGNLNFTFRLVMAPLSVLEYVVVHELAHLRHRNHGKRFWKEVAMMYPDYASARIWLRYHGHTLTL